MEEFNKLTILSCPFCQSRLFEEGMTIADLEFNYYGYGPPPSYALRCTECGASGPSALGDVRDDHYGAKMEAIKAWNSRVVYGKSKLESVVPILFWSNKQCKLC